MHHLVLEDEVPDALEALIATVTEETGAASEIEARLARRLAIALWKGERAERIETALFDAAPKLRPPQAGFEWEEADPLTTFDVKRFNAVPRLPGPARPRDQPLPEGVAPLRMEALARHGRTRGGAGKGTRDPAQRPTTTFDSTCRFSRLRGKTNLTLAAAWDAR